MKRGFLIFLLINFSILPSNLNLKKEIEETNAIETTKIINKSSNNRIYKEKNKIFRVLGTYNIDKFSVKNGNVSLEVKNENRDNVINEVNEIINIKNIDYNKDNSLIILQGELK